MPRKPANKPAGKPGTRRSDGSARSNLNAGGGGAESVPDAPPPKRKRDAASSAKRAADSSSKRAAASSPKRDAGSSSQRDATPSPKRDQPLLIVAIGASAGGLEAFKSFFAQMPADNGMAFVLVQHLAPQHTSLLSELVGRSTAMLVAEAVDGEQLQADHVYVIPPDATLTIADGALQVSKPAPPRQHRWPINTFFTSLAEDQGDCAVCIVLSGTGSDGARGLRAVKERGGLTLAQSGFDHAAMIGMPASAAATGLVDHILPVEEMPARLLAHKQHLRISDSRKGPDGERQDLASHLRTICALLRAQVGHDFSQYKEKTLTRRIQRRMHVVQVETVPDYIAYLREHPDEHQALFREVLIGVTEFFRDPKAFEALQTSAIPTLLAGKGAADTLRVWVPGCATGEEAYSIAIAIRETMRRGGGRGRGNDGNGGGGEPKVLIFATDIDDYAIAAARAGRYKAPLTGVSPERQERWFTRDGDDWCVVKAIREMCVFSPHSAIKDPPFSRMDLVSCRNLLIYLNGDLQERLIGTFHYALQPGGYLLLGPSEGLGRNGKLFTVVDKSHRLYTRRKDSGVGRAALPARRGAGDRGAGDHGADDRDTQPARGAFAARTVGADDAIERGARRALESWMPAYVVIDGNHDILRFEGETGRYLGPSAGAASLNLFGLLHRGLRVASRAAIKQAMADGKPVVQSGLSVIVGGQRQRLRLIAAPLPDSDAGKGLCALAFDELESAAVSDRADGADRSDAGSSEAVQGLERELAGTRAELQAALEHRSTVEEEMKSANEEYQSVNEELQSANEELETSKEEMQSINEELQTVNAEMHSKNETLAHLNSDLQNLLDSTQIATLFLDSQLRVSNFTPMMTEVYHLRDSDRGRPLTEIAARIDYPELRHDVAEVLRNLAVVERTLPPSEKGIAYQLRMRPYRTVDNVIDGVVLTFVDITENRKHELERGQLAAIVESSREMIIGHDLQGTIISWNRAAERGLGYQATRVTGKPISLLLPGANAAQARELLQACEQQRRTTETQMEWLRLDGSVLQVAVSCSPVLDDAGEVVGGSLIARDIDEKVRAEQALRASERHLAQLVEQTTVGIAETDFDGRLLRVNPAYCEIVGRSAQDLHGMRKQDITHPEDVPAYLQQLRALVAGGPAFRIEKRYLRPDGSEVWVDDSVSLLTDADGKPQRVLAMLQDISERRRAAGHQQLLLGELNHRVKNTLASVQAIAQQTVASASDLDDFRDTFLQRLQALSKTHNLLAEDAWRGIGLRELVLGELAPYRHEGEHRIALTGNAVQLTPKTALALSMALHELATNAGKYGALSVPQGRVEVEWKTRASKGEQRLQLRWIERDGPPVAPPTRSGFGTRLIGDGLAFELDGKVDLAFEPDGVTCRIDVPLSEIESAP